MKIRSGGRERGFVAWIGVGGEAVVDGERILLAGATVAMAFSLVVVALLVVVPVPVPCCLSVYLYTVSVLQFFVSPPHYQRGRTRTTIVKNARTRVDYNGAK